MKQLVDMLLENLSTREVFLFRIACGTCAAEFGGNPVRFSKAGIMPPTEGKRIIFEACYEQEFRSARQAAIRDAAEHLNYCPICKRLILDKKTSSCNGWRKNWKLWSISSKCRTSNSGATAMP